MDYENYKYLLYVDVFNSVFLENMTHDFERKDFIKYRDILFRLIEKYGGTVLDDETDGLVILFNKNVLEFIKKLNSSLLKFKWTEETIKYNLKKKNNTGYIFKGISVRMAIDSLSLKRAYGKYGEYWLAYHTKKIKHYHKYINPGEVFLSKKVANQIMGSKLMKKVSDIENEFIFYKRRNRFYIIENIYKERVSYLNHKKDATKYYFLESKKYINKINENLITQ
ncbi:hypothetical protein SLOPH_676 [Spraguea lophii 42_110]|uniref:Guanylate cyclase domain-containing protein n=1 Tax=Spraguea lophii (strain 42_110) TaxID=1358809 RepID=S7XPD8_SPRLO|nr:hypothetical protein SLOPH_676 [Spraguea lophii 42_110]